MKILSIKISNMLSIESADIDFEDSGLVLVEGWNYDDGRATGAGKTAIFNALSFGLYGKLPRKMTASDILRDGAKKGFVTVNIQVGNGLYSVHRERPAKVTYAENGAVIDIDQAGFEKIVKLSYDQFLMSMYAAQGGQNRLINKNDTEKKDFLLQLMNLNEFNACKKEAEAAAKELNKAIEDLEHKKTIIKTQIDVYAASSIDPQIQKIKIDQLNARIKDFNEQIIELQSVQKPDLSKYSKLEFDIRNKQQSFAEARAKKSVLHQQYRQLEAQYVPFSAPKPDAECPHCFNEINIKGKSVVKADDIAALEKQHREHLTEIRHEMSSVKTRIDELDVILTSEKKVLTLQEQLNTKKQEEYAEYDKASKKIGELRLLMRSDEIQSKNLTDELEKQSQIANKVDTLFKSIEKLEIDITAKRKDAEILDTVSAIYSPTGAQAYIVDYVVDSFNESVAEYIDLIWPNATYKLNAFKEKKDGDVVAKFSETLVINGKQKSIGMLSGGEFRAVSLIMDFAVISMLSKQFGMPLNPIILDEPFEGLDTVGTEIVIDLLDKLSQDRQIWVIDHASESKTMFSKVVRVEKRQDISRIVQTT